MMEYKGYFGKDEYDDDAEIFRGRVLNLTNDIITFQGHSVEDIKKDFIEQIDFYLKCCEETGDTPEKPFSGKYIVRINPELHRKITMSAKHRDLSINKFTEIALEHEIEREH